MDHHAQMPAIDWVTRVNRAWIVHSNLNDHADAWLQHLADLGDARLQASCETARALCELREPLDNPKPWFYAGLFGLATAEEAKHFLASHRITKATVPAMVDDEDVMLWIDRIGPDTRELLARLRAGLVRVSRNPPV